MLASEQQIRVMIVDDHPVVRTGLKTMLESELDITVIALSESGEEALRDIELAHPEVVLLDLRMPGKDGIQTIVDLRRVSPDVRVLVLSNSRDDESISKAFRAGASGFLFKNMPQEEIIRAVRIVHMGQRYLTEEVSLRLVENMNHKQLSERELEVLRLVCQGLSNKEIGQRLFISDKTVRNHVSSCLVKLDADDRTGATTRAIQRGLIHLDQEFAETQGLVY